MKTKTYRIKPEFCLEEEQDIVYRITNYNEVTNRCYIDPVNTDLNFAPQELVDFNMLEEL